MLHVYVPQNRRSLEVEGRGIDEMSNLARFFEIGQYGDVTITGEELEIFYQCSVLMFIEQWGFFRVPHPLWQRAFVYNGHLPGPVTLTLIAERLTVHGVVTTCFLRLRSIAAGIRNPTFRLRDILWDILQILCTLLGSFLKGPATSAW